MGGRAEDSAARLSARPGHPCAGLRTARGLREAVRSPRRGRSGYRRICAGRDGLHRRDGHQAIVLPAAKGKAEGRSPERVLRLQLGRALCLYAPSIEQLAHIYTNIMQCSTVYEVSQ